LVWFELHPVDGAPRVPRHFGAIGWLLIAKKPIVNLMVFKDWHFSIGCLLNAAGFGIVYASAVVIRSLPNRCCPTRPPGPGWCYRLAGLHSWC